MPNERHMLFPLPEPQFSKYFFHFLPGLPILIGLCILFWQTLECYLKDMIGGWGAALVLTFSILLMFLLGLISDTIRHAMEEMFLVPKGAEYKIVERLGVKIDEDDPRSVGYNWEVIERIQGSDTITANFMAIWRSPSHFCWA